MDGVTMAANGRRLEGSETHTRADVYEAVRAECNSRYQEMRREWIRGDEQPRADDVLRMSLRTCIRLANKVISEFNLTITHAYAVLRLGNLSTNGTVSSTP